jgi:hypothetical protein
LNFFLIFSDKKYVEQLLFWFEYRVGWFERFLIILLKVTNFSFESYFPYYKIEIQQDLYKFGDQFSIFSINQPKEEVDPFGISSILISGFFINFFLVNFSLINSEFRDQSSDQNTNQEGKGIQKLARVG